MAGFIGDLDTRLISDDESGVFQLLSTFSFKSDVAGITIVVPIGFQTDFCSVPRVPLAYDMLGNRARKSGTVHDYLYSSHIVTREVADRVLREMLQLDGVDECEAQMFYLAVRAGGGSHWGPDPAKAA